MSSRKLTPEDLERMRSVGHLSEGYSKKKKVTITDKRGSKQTEHFSGRVDAEIMAPRIKVKSGATGTSRPSE